MESHVISITLAGIGATLVMTMFTEIAFRLLKKPYHVIQVLANMMSFKSNTPLVGRPFPETIVAIMLHFSIGVFFAFGYHSFAVWVPDWPSLLQAVMYGIFIAIVAIGGWSLFFELHPGPPLLHLPVYLMIIGLGHLALAFCLVCLV